MRQIRGDEDYWEPTLFLGIGQAHAVATADEDEGTVVGRLVLPDPEQRRGWREFYVKRPPETKPGARPIGFGR